MFICDICEKSTLAKEKMHKRVLVRRERIYAGGTKGWEPSVEIKLCTHCVRKVDDLYATTK